MKFLLPWSVTHYFYCSWTVPQNPPVRLLLFPRLWTGHKKYFTRITYSLFVYTELFFFLWRGRRWEKTQYLFLLHFFLSPLYDFFFSLLSFLFNFNLHLFVRQNGYACGCTIHVDSNWITTRYLPFCPFIILYYLAQVELLVITSCYILFHLFIVCCSLLKLTVP